MSLILCPECGHEVSTTAAACPNCARPLHAPPVVERKVIVAQPLDREGGFPTWALIPIGLLGIVLIFVAYIAFRGGDDTANTNVNVNVASKRPATDTRTTSTSTVPSTSVPASRACSAAFADNDGSRLFNGSAGCSSSQQRNCRTQREGDIGKRLDTGGQGDKILPVGRRRRNSIESSPRRTNRGKHSGGKPRARCGFS